MRYKKDRRAKAIEDTEAEKERILKVMREADIYTKTLDPLIESYLDIFEIYQTMFIEWRHKNFPTTQRHTNKNGSTNNVKHPLAQQVEVWADKKTKALDLLGLTNKGNRGNGITGGSTARQNETVERPEPVVNELEAHRNKWRGKAGG